MHILQKAFYPIHSKVKVYFLLFKTFRTIIQMRMVTTISGSVFPTGISILITAFWGNDMITFAGTNWGLVTIFVICIFLIQKVKMNPVWVMLLAGVMKVGVSCAQRL